jgi:hypothetical protein
MINWFKTRSNRVYLYLVGLALAPILVSYGYISKEDVPLWLGLLLAVLGLGTATVKVNEKGK